MSWNPSDWLSLQAQRVTVGMNSWLVLSGGFLAVLGLFLGAEVGDMSKSLLGCLILFMLGGIAVIWDCGRRILDTRKNDVDKAEVAQLLMMLKSRSQEIESLDAEGYLAQITKDPEPEDPRTNGVLEFVSNRLFEIYGPTECAIFASTSKPPEPNIDKDHPMWAAETARIHMAEHLKTLCASLRSIMERHD